MNTLKIEVILKYINRRKKVAYADYRSGMFYISPHECIIQK